VQVQSDSGGKLTYLLGEPFAFKVQPVQHSGKLPKRQGTNNKRFANEFADNLLHTANHLHFNLQSKIVCAIVGQKSVLEHEILNTRLAIHVNGGPRIEGCLQDILRVDRFLTGRQSYHSALIPAGSKSVTNEIVNKVESGVIFDGAIGFLNWSAIWPRLHQVVVLDRSEPYFDEAIVSINSRFSQNRVETELTETFNDLPAGSEILAFREAKS
jgi:hypothetical protein